MTNSALTLLVDTNLFFEGKRLEDLPWDEFGVDTVTILLIRPVLDEIDKHKSGTGRTRKRALEIFGRVRSMLKSDSDSLVIQEDGPRVVLQLSSGLQVDPEISPHIDTSKSDDRLVGILSSAIKADPDGEYCLFTHDSGPAATAGDLGLPFTFIDDHWLRDDPPTPAEKRVSALQTKLSQYQDQEPKISVKLDGLPSAEGPVVLTCQTARALSAEQIETLVSELKTRFPMQTDFSVPSDYASDPDVTIEPPGEEAIETYQNSQYPEWIAASTDYFETLHEKFVRPPSSSKLVYSITNAGSRPSIQTRVSFHADGDIWFERRSPRGDDLDDDDQVLAEEPRQPSPRLPAPPRAPTPKRIVKPKPQSAAKAALRLKGTDIAQLRALKGMFPMQSEMARIARQHEEMRRLVDPLGLNKTALGIEPVFRGPPIHSLLPSRPPKHDPEAFYYDDWPSDCPVESGALTCDLWRHQSGAQPFDLEVHADAESRNGGSLRFEVHAENLTQPIMVRTKIIVSDSDVNTYAEAQKLIEGLSN